MGKIKLLVISIICALLTLVGCGPQQRLEVYHIGEKYSFAGVNIEVLDEADKERYVVTYTMNEESIKENYFNFIFTFQNSTTLKNSEEFEYYDNLGNIISFSKDGNFLITKDITIYISYKKARDDIKQSIRKKIVV